MIEIIRHNAQVALAEGGKGDFFPAKDLLEVFADRDNYRERALLAEARTRALEETVGVLLEGR